MRARPSGCASCRKCSRSLCLFFRKPQRSGLHRDWINVAYLGGVEDTTSKTGDFSIGVVGGGRQGSLVDNCSAQIDPTRAFRTEIARHRGLSVERVWMGSLLPLQGPHGIQQQLNWDRSISSEDWGRNAAESLERIILRCKSSAKPVLSAFSL